METTNKPETPTFPTPCPLSCQSILTPKTIFKWPFPQQELQEVETGKENFSAELENLAELTDLGWGEEF